MPDEDKPAPLRPATPARSRLRAVASPETEPEPQDEPERGEEGAAPPPRLVDRIHQLAERIEEESAAVRDQQPAEEHESDAAERAVRAATAKHAEQAAQRVAGAATQPGRHEAPEPLPPLPLPEPVGQAEEQLSAPDAVVDEPTPGEQAPAVKAAAKKAAKKAPAKKATATTPGKKAPVAKPAAKKAAAKKAPAKKAPGKKVAAAVAASEAVAEATPTAPFPPSPPVAVPAEEAAPAEHATAGAPRGVPAPPPRPRQRPVVAAMSDTDTIARPITVAPPPRVVPTTVVPSQPTGRGARLLLRVTVVLLALAAGLGVAAYVESGAESWRSRVALRLVPGAAPTVDPTTAVRTGVDRYSRRVPDLTARAAEIMGIPAEDVRGRLSATQLDDDIIGITGEAAKGDQAQLLAGAAATELMRIIQQEEKNVAATPADRLTVQVSAPVSKPERTRPDDVVAALAGALTALAVLLLAGLASLVRRARS